MNFATLPPEINSGRMFSGPGAGIDDRGRHGLGQAGRTAVRRGGGLSGGDLKAGGTATTQAAAPYITWLDAIAAQAEHAATQAAAAAAPTNRR